MIEIDTSDFQLHWIAVALFVIAFAAFAAGTVLSKNKPNARATRIQNTWGTIAGVIAAMSLGWAIVSAVLFMQVEVPNAQKEALAGFYPNTVEVYNYDSDMFVVELEDGWRVVHLEQVEDSQYRVVEQ